jgi:hypothetical protein
MVWEIKSIFFSEASTQAAASLLEACHCLERGEQALLMSTTDFS